MLRKSYVHELGTRHLYKCSLQNSATSQTASSKDCQGDRLPCHPQPFDAKLERIEWNWKDFPSKVFYRGPTTFSISCYGVLDTLASNEPQTHPKRTSNTFQADLKHTSNAPQSTSNATQLNAPQTQLKAHLKALFKRISNAP